ncbi:Oidioi.mRNA.OKI2018_I69.XSR.g15090.t1.cds [Oikopleura dioica]|uniref:Oidioi.mRNA.OKI2018_I69.XSR.g15090.t1.cds n=1 Tax=Oikopleura dioica TaxID=34765 RepID=A0ABN7SKU3_OIKDI|nr:Oidioi.mRNA.OKI2018_I69.XSR.g15090.t1.cds [Oikopleura dioica]
MIVGVAFCLVLSVQAKKDMQFYCEVCTALVEESHWKVSNVDPKKTIDTGSGRVDPNGQMKEKKKQWRLSETHLTEVFETVCRNIADDYVIENGDNGEKYVKRMMTFDGAMNTDIDFQKLVADKEETPDKSPSHDPLKIRWTCENILEEVEEDLIEAFQTFAIPEDEMEDDEMTEFVCGEVYGCDAVHDEL